MGKGQYLPFLLSGKKKKMGAVSSRSSRGQQWAHISQQPDPKQPLSICLWLCHLSITEGLPWFMDLRFQVPMHYCSLQHRTLLLSPVTSATGYWFCFGSIPSFFLELFIHWSPVAYWAPTDLGSSSFSILSFCLFILFMGFSRQNTEVACHSLLQWTMLCQTSPPWPTRLGLPHAHSLVSLRYTMLWS